MSVRVIYAVTLDVRVIVGGIGVILGVRVQIWCLAILDLALDMLK